MGDSYSDDDDDGLMVIGDVAIFFWSGSLWGWLVE
jgi:hypothetical protein